MFGKAVENDKSHTIPLYSFIVGHQYIQLQVLNIHRGTVRKEQTQSVYKQYFKGLFINRFLNVPYGTCTETSRSLFEYNYMCVQKI